MALSGLLAIVLAQNQYTLLAGKLGVPYDPENGYFDYMLAAENLEGLGPFQKALEERQAHSEAIDPKFQGKTALEIRRMAIVAFPNAVRLIDAARTKKAWVPQKNDPAAKPLKVASLMTVARFSVDFRAESEFAEGRPHAATACLVDALRLSETSISSGNFVGFLTGTVNTTRFFNGVEAHLLHLSLPDCQALDQGVQPLLTVRQTLIPSLQKQVLWMDQSLENIRNAPKEELKEAGLGFLEPLSPADLSRYIGEAKALHRKRISEMAEPLALDLRNFAAYLEMSESPERPDNATLEQLPVPQRILAQVSMDSLGQVPERAFLQEVRFHLVRATLAIWKYRWTYDRLPIKLADAGPAEIMTDPVSGQAYKYKIKGQEFDLSATGTKAMGEIRLSYGGKVVSDGPPPLLYGSSLWR